MKKVISIALIAMLVVAMAGCSQSQPAATTAAPAGTAAQTTAAPQTEAPAALSGTVATDGSTSMEKVIGALGEAFMEANSGVNFTYNPTGSGSGITAVSEGRCDIGLSSRALKDSEVASGLVGTVLAYDGIAVIVNPANTVEDLDIETIAKIYTGEITNWSEVGGADAEIVLVGREAGSGTRSVPVPSGADLHRRRHHRGRTEPRRHRLRFPGLRQGFRQGSEGRGRDPQRRDRQGRHLPHPASLRSGHQGRRCAEPRRPGILRLCHQGSGQ